MSQENPSQRIILSEYEFEYMQFMLDFGSTMEEALMAIRPALSREAWHIEDIVVSINRNRNLPS